MGLIKRIITEKLETGIYQTRAEMGVAAAVAAADAIRSVLAEKPFANVIFAAAYRRFPIWMTKRSSFSLKGRNVCVSSVNLIRPLVSMRPS